MRIWNAEDVHARVFELNQYCTDPVKLAKREEYGTKSKRSTSK